MELSDKEEILQISMAAREPYTVWFLVAIVLNIVFAITATCGNTVILAALFKESSLHPPSKTLFRSLALTDLFVGLLTEPLFVVFLMTTVYERWDIYIYVIPVTYVAGVSLCSVSLFTLTAISVDRLLALLLGLRYKQIVTVKRVFTIVISSWTVNTSLAMSAFWNFYTFSSYCAFVGTLLCLAVSSCCYIKIYHKLLHHQAQIQEQVHQSNGEEPLNIARYRKTVSSALWVQLTLVVCYLPVGVVLAFISIERLTPPLWVAWILSGTLALFNSTLNPILYCWKIREVRRAVKDTIRQISFCLW